VDGAITTNKIAVGAITAASAILADASVTNANIVDAAITNAKIADAAITNAKIGTAAITYAKIADLAVDTLKIADNAVTFPVSVYAADKIEVYIYDSGWSTPTTIQQATIVTEGGNVLVWFGADLSMSGTCGTGSATAGTYIQLWRDSTLLYETPTVSVSAFSDGTANDNPSDQDRLLACPPIYLDTPVAGTYTYYMKMRSTNSGSWYTNVVAFPKRLSRWAISRSLSLLEVKK
jgi:hypothetical protein